MTNTNAGVLNIVGVAMPTAVDYSMFVEAWDNIYDSIKRGFVEVFVTEQFNAYGYLDVDAMNVPYITSVRKGVTTVKYPVPMSGYLANYDSRFHNFFHCSGCSGRYDKFPFNVVGVYDDEGSIQSTLVINHILDRMAYNEYPIDHYGRPWNEFEQGLIRAFASTYKGADVDKVMPFTTNPIGNDHTTENERKHIGTHLVSQSDIDKYILGGEKCSTINELSAKYESILSNYARYDDSVFRTVVEYLRRNATRIEMADKYRFLVMGVHDIIGLRKNNEAGPCRVYVVNTYKASTLSVCNTLADNLIKAAAVSLTALERAVETHNVRGGVGEYKTATVMADERQLDEFVEFLTSKGFTLDSLQLRQCTLQEFIDCNPDAKFVMPKVPEQDDLSKLYGKLDNVKAVIKGIKPVSAVKAHQLISDAVTNQHSVSATPTVHAGAMRESSYILNAGIPLISDDPIFKDNYKIIRMVDGSKDTIRHVNVFNRPSPVAIGLIENSIIGIANNTGIDTNISMAYNAEVFDADWRLHTNALLAYSTRVMRPVRLYDPIVTFDVLSVGTNFTIEDDSYITHYTITCIE